MSKTYKQRNKELEAQLALMTSGNAALREGLACLAGKVEYQDGPWIAIAFEYMREVETLKDKMARMQTDRELTAQARDEVVARLARQLSGHEAYRDKLEARHLEDMDTIRELRAMLKAVE